MVLFYQTRKWLPCIEQRSQGFHLSFVLVCSFAGNTIPSSVRSLFWWRADCVSVCRLDCQSNVLVLAPLFRAQVRDIFVSSCVCYIEYIKHRGICVLLSLKSRHMVTNSRSYSIKSLAASLSVLIHVRYAQPLNIVYLQERDTLSNRVSATRRWK